MLAPGSTQAPERDLDGTARPGPLAKCTLSRACAWICVTGTGEVVRVGAEALRPGLAWHPVRGWLTRTAEDVAHQLAVELGQTPNGVEPDGGDAGGAEQVVEARTSKRARRDRLMVVDGYSVLRVNNYTLQSGEPSVFDAELGAHAPMLAPPAVREVHVKQRGKSKGAPQRQSKLSPDEMRRQDHNKAIDIARATLAPRRAAFLESHIAALEPFVSQVTLTHIRRMAAAAPKAGKAPPPAVHGPPSQVTATLRPHQQEGLRWLSHMFHSGVNAILADEMVRSPSLSSPLCVLFCVTLLYFVLFSPSGLGQDVADNLPAGSPQV